jgi:uncharacterized phage infection (PIP) family protein YhgE
MTEKTGADAQNVEVKSDATDASETVAYWKEQAKEAFKQRDELKKQLKTIEPQLIHLDELKKSQMQMSSQLKEFESKVQKVDALENFVQAQFQSTVEKLPENLQRILPESLDILSRLKLAQELQEQFSLVVTEVKKEEPKPKLGQASPSRSQTFDISRMSESDRKKAIAEMSPDERKELLRTLKMP